MIVFNQSNRVTSLNLLTFSQYSPYSRAAFCRDHQCRKKPDGPELLRAVWRKFYILEFGFSGKSQTTDIQRVCVRVRRLRTGLTLLFFPRP